MNTKVDTIKLEVQSLILDLENNNDYNTVLLQEKYNYLYITSKTLFNFIIKSSKNDKKDYEQFNLNLNKMLNYIINIQNNELTQNDASEHIGNLLANQFIPQLKNKN